MSFLGADTDELRDAGQKCQDGKETTDGVIAFLKALIIILRAASFFTGGASEAYATFLETQVVPWLQKISTALGLFAQVLNANAEAQDQISAGETVDLGQLPTYQTPSGLPPTITPYDGNIAGPTNGQIGTDGTGSTENAVLVEGRLHKIGEELRWEYDRSDWQRPWRIHGRTVDARFHPFHERASRTNLGVVGSETHQCFGEFSGWATTDDGERVDLAGLVGWAEEARQRW